MVSASSRRGSSNTRLADLARDMLREHGGTPTSATIEEFGNPEDDRDVQDGTGFPAGAERLRHRLDEADAFQPPRTPARFRPPYATPARPLPATGSSN